MRFVTFFIRTYCHIEISDKMAEGIQYGLTGMGRQCKRAMANNRRNDNRFGAFTTMPTEWETVSKSGDIQLPKIFKRCMRAHIIRYACANEQRKRVPISSNAIHFHFMAFIHSILNIIKTKARKAGLWLRRFFFFSTLFMLC